MLVDRLDTSKSEFGFGFEDPKFRLRLIYFFGHVLEPRFIGSQIWGGSNRVLDILLFLMYENQVSLDYILVRTTNNISDSQKNLDSGDRKKHTIHCSILREL